MNRIFTQMTCIKVLFMSALLVGGLTGCGGGGDDPNPTPPSSNTLKVDQEAVTLTAKTPVTVNVTAGEGMSWVVSSDALWMTITPASGTGNAKLTITYTNPGYREMSTTARVFVESAKNSPYANAALSVTSPNPDNKAPEAPTQAVYPENGATNVDQQLRLAWNEAVDPDKDKLTYIVEYSKDKTNWTAIGDKEGIKSTGYGDPGKTLDPSTTYYWRVTSWDMFGAKSAPSEIFSFTTKEAVAGTWKDGETRLYQNNATQSGKSFTLIVTGDGFTAADMGPGGAWEQASTRAIEGLFNYVEPYKTYRPYIRIWRIGAISEKSGISQKTGGTETACDAPVNTRFGSMRDSGSNSAWCGIYGSVYPGQPGALYAEGKPTYGNTKYGTDGYIWAFVRESLPEEAKAQVAQNCAVLVIQNIATYNGTVGYYDDGSNRTLGFLCRSTGAVGGSTGYENVMVHEIGGHAIGHLADEYIRAGTISAQKISDTKDFQALGWYQNVDVTGKKETSPWAHFFTAKEYKAYYSKVGFYEGARSATNGIWRAESISCMDNNQFYFNAASRYSIVKQLKAAAEETLNWQDFVNKDYDREKANTGTRVALTPPDFTPLPEPTIIKTKLPF